MTEIGTCPTCGAALEGEGLACPSCDDLLAGSRQVVRVPLQQEAVLAHGLLQSAGFHATLAYLDQGDVPHPIDPAEPYLESLGLMIPFTAYGVYVPEEEAEEALRVLEDARRALPEGDDTPPPEIIPS